MVYPLEEVAGISVFFFTDTPRKYFVGGLVHWFLDAIEIKLLVVGLDPKFSICCLLLSSHKFSYFLFIGRPSPKFVKLSVSKKGPKFAHVKYFLHSEKSPELF